MQGRRNGEPQSTGQKGTAIASAALNWQPVGRIDDAEFRHRSKRHGGHEIAVLARQEPRITPAAWKQK
jgi:hypothetical protein